MLDDFRDLMQSLGVAQSAANFACPKCGARSFAVLHGCPMEVECLKCGMVAPYSVAVGYAENRGEPLARSRKGGLGATAEYSATPKGE